MTRSRTMRVLSLSLLSIAISMPLPAHAPEGYEWAISDGKSETVIATGRDSLTILSRLEKELDVPFIYVQHDGKEYVIKDPATVRMARQIFEDDASIDDLEMRIEAHAADLERVIERDLEQSLERFEQRMAVLEARIESGSLAALGEIDEALEELDLERITSIAAEVENHTREIEQWADDLQERIDEDMVPLFEDAIRRGIAEPLR